MVISAGKWKDPTVGASRSSTPPDENVTGASGVFNHSQRLIDNDGHKGSLFSFSRLILPHPTLLTNEATYSTWEATNFILKVFIKHFTFIYKTLGSKVILDFFV